MQAGERDPMVLAESFDDDGLLLGHLEQARADGGEREDGQEDEDDHGVSPSIVEEGSSLCRA